MAKDKRVWRKVVKKLRRQRKRQKLAKDLEAKIILDGEREKLGKDARGCERRDDEIEKMENIRLQEEIRLHKFQEAQWLERERQIQLEFEIKKSKEERLAKAKIEEERKIKEEWEKKLQRQKQLKEENERLQKELQEKQVEALLKHNEEEFNRFLGFLSGDFETPPLPYLMPESVDDGKEVCQFFNRTAACRFYDRCTRSHPRPTLSQTILISNFFSHFSMEQILRDEYDTNLSLEYEDSDLYNEFLEFYADVMPEFRKCGNVIQFKVCCNCEIHLRGNVYIQYENIGDAVKAYRKFNGRFYNGKQLSLQFIKMDSWRSAMCGLFNRGLCHKGRTCSFLHVFRNPTKQFVSADHDWLKPLSIASVSNSSRSLTNNKIEGSSKMGISRTEHKSSEKTSERHREKSSSVHNFRSRSRNISKNSQHAQRNNSRSDSRQSRHRRNNRLSQETRSSNCSRSKCLDYRKSRRERSRSKLRSQREAARTKNDFPSYSKSKNSDNHQHNGNKAESKREKINSECSHIGKQGERMNSKRECASSVLLENLELKNQRKSKTTADSRINAVPDLVSGTSSKSKHKRSKKSKSKTKKSKKEKKEKKSKRKCKTDLETHVMECSVEEFNDPAAIRPSVDFPMEKLTSS